MNVRWVPPKLEIEIDELFRVSEEELIDMRYLIQAFLGGELKTLDISLWNSMKNTESNDPTLSIDAARMIARSYERDIDRIINGFERGNQIPAPTVLLRPSRLPELVAGNTRLLAARALGIIPKIWIIRMSK